MNPTNDLDDGVHRPQPPTAERQFNADQLSPSMQAIDAGAEYLERTGICPDTSTALAAAVGVVYAIESTGRTIQ